jgi:predicted nucleotide-binding protein
MMALPIKTVVEDIAGLCGYLASKPTGATPKEAKAVVDSKLLDTRKLSALKQWGFIEEANGRLKLLPRGRDYVRSEAPKRQAILRDVVSCVKPYSAIVERAKHRGEASVSAPDVAAHWHDHFGGEVGDSDGALNSQANCFFHLAQGAGLGSLIVGRNGSPTRFDWDTGTLSGYAPAQAEDLPAEKDDEESLGAMENKKSIPASPRSSNGDRLGQAIFLAHGKNKKPLEQLQRILAQFKIPFHVVVDEPNLGRPISLKVKETMKQCNCAILIFTADEKFVDSNGSEVWRPSENVVYELGACGYLYGDRVVVIKEDRVKFPTNFRDLGYIEFTESSLDAKAMDIVKELIGFGIVKITT